MFIHTLQEQDIEKEIEREGEGEREKMNASLVMLTRPFFPGTPEADAERGKGLTSKIFLQNSIVV